MYTHCAKLSPGKPKALESHHQQLIEFWNALRTCGDPGATTWEVLEPLELQVTEYLDMDPPDIAGASSTTALAALLITGGYDA